ncbi:peptide-methionine (S)-S-oxide reductase MsrA [Polycyclovorans algicola]|uniref:peptide-methionine (S)-S-oxide reductase MsrA n=1 Tax=Polycyclovorans algicola TaxID=616992 RepID=UPI000693319C|nr:peptide-methionine (S)-S-oxide reductase MsrA [Polycyclovorans algicola]
MATLTAEQLPDLADSLAAAGGGRLVLGGGCFWCTEAVFVLVDGVTEVTPGYAGGAAATAHYADVCSGQTGHAEVIDVRFDPSKVSAETLLKIFFAVAHDPTQVNRQGHDVGTQYRSAVFAVDAAQAAGVRDYIETLNAAGVFSAPVATEVTALEAFYPAEAAHHDYARRHPGQPYIQGVAAPKVEKLNRQWGGFCRRAPG